LNRLYILTDGELHDAEACYEANSKLQVLESEVHAYGFGQEFAMDTMKRILQGVPGGTVKPIFNTRDAEQHFEHIGDLTNRIVAQEATLTFRFADGVIAGDVFRFRPSKAYLGPVLQGDPSIDGERMFLERFATLEAERMYTYLFEGQIRRSKHQEHEIGRIAVRYKRQNAWEQIELPVIAARTQNARRITQRNEEAFQIAQALEVLRTDDPEDRLESLMARLAIYDREGADPDQRSLVDQAIQKLQQGYPLSAKEERGLQADDITRPMITRPNR
jgi:hypothetical protein